MFKQKRNKFNQWMIAITSTALVIFCLALVGVWWMMTVDTDTEAVSQSFDYTRDRDQYWYPAVAPETFDYMRDRDQYWYPAVAPETFDYTRDRDQYWYPAVAPETFDYTRDRDQYWQGNQ